MRSTLKNHKLNFLENKKYDNIFRYITGNFAIYIYNIKAICRYDKKGCYYNMVYNF